MTEKEGLRGLERLDNALLMEVKIKAVKLNLDSELIKILDEEIAKRVGRSQKQTRKSFLDVE